MQALHNTLRAGMPYLLLAVLLVAIIVPFLLFGEQVEAWSKTVLNSPIGLVAVAGFIAVLLFLDTLLPIPSSLLATAAGALLGFLPGTLVVFVGLVAGNCLGYGLGAFFGKAALARFAGYDGGRNPPGALGMATLVATRAVPVLAEALTVIAGVRAMPLKQFLAAVVPANLGVAAVYAWLGAIAAERDSFLLVFAASVLVPALAWLAFRLYSKGRSMG